MIRQNDDTAPSAPSAVGVPGPKRSRIRAITSGVAAILTWVGCYLFVEWYKAGGFWLYWAAALTLIAVFWVLAKISSRANHAVGNSVADILSRIFENYEENIEWVGWFLLFIPMGAFIYFLLVAPYGILCHLGIKTCGQ